MSFLNPLFLVGLISVAVPILIYLWNVRKPKRVRFSTLAFFETLKNTALKRIRFKRWLLLLIRALAIIAMVIAASRPFVPPDFGWGTGSEPKAVAILIDNGPSMEQISRDGPYIEIAKYVAEAIIELSGNEDRLTLEVSHGESISVPMLNSGPLTPSLRQVEVVNAGNYMAERLESVIQRLRDADEPNKILYLITDSREITGREIEKLSGNLYDEIYMKVVRVDGAETLNFGFERVEIESTGGETGGELLLRVVVRNYGNRMISNSFLSLVLDQELISQQGFSIDARSTTDFVFELPVSDNQLIAAELILEGDELEFDNHFYGGIRLPGIKNILVLSDDRRTEMGSGSDFTSYLRPMLEIASEDGRRFNIMFSQPEEFDTSQLSDYDAIVLDGIRNIPDFLGQTLIDHVQNGAGLLFMPNAEGNMANYNRFLGYASPLRFSNVYGSYASFDPIDRLAIPDDGHPILETIFDRSEDEELRLNVPEIFYYYEIEAASRPGDFSILNSRTGRALLYEVRAGAGRMVVSAIGSDPGWSNFPVKPLFAPLFYRTVDYLARGEGAMIQKAELGEAFRFRIDGNPENARLMKDGETIIPEIRQTVQGADLSYPGIEWLPGWLTVQTADQKFLIGLNQSTMESEFRTLDNTEMERILSEKFPQVQMLDLKNEMGEIARDLELATFGREIWYWFVFIAIILLLLESLISRYYKAESFE